MGRTEVHFCGRPKAEASCQTGGDNYKIPAALGILVMVGVGVVGVGVLTRKDLVRRKERRNERLRNERKMLAAVEDPCLVGVLTGDVTEVVVPPPVAMWAGWPGVVVTT